MFILETHLVRFLKLVSCIFMQLLKNSDTSLPYSFIFMYFSIWLANRFPVDIDKKTKGVYCWHRLDGGLRIVYTHLYMLHQTCVWKYYRIKDCVTILVFFSCLRHPTKAAKSSVEILDKFWSLPCHMGSMYLVLMKWSQVFYEEKSSAWHWIQWFHNSDHSQHVLALSTGIKPIHDLH